MSYARILFHIITEHFALEETHKDFKWYLLTQSKVLIKKLGR